MHFHQNAANSVHIEIIQQIWNKSHFSHLRFWHFKQLNAKCAQLTPHPESPDANVKLPRALKSLLWARCIERGCDWEGSFPGLCWWQQSAHKQHRIQSKPFIVWSFCVWSTGCLGGWPGGSSPPTLLIMSEFKRRLYEKGKSLIWKDPKGRWNNGLTVNLNITVTPSSDALVRLVLVCWWKMKHAGQYSLCLHGYFLFHLPELNLSI